MASSGSASVLWEGEARKSTERKAGGLPVGHVGRASRHEQTLHGALPRGGSMRVGIKPSPSAEDTNAGRGWRAYHGMSATEASR